MDDTQDGTERITGRQVGNAAGIEKKSLWGGMA